jgi:hypothetical protein
LDPENHRFLEETNLPSPMTTRVYDHLLEGSFIFPRQVGTSAARPGDFRHIVKIFGK